MSTSVRNDPAFRQMILTHSWQQGDLTLPRKISGCDIDHVIHTRNDGGAMLYCEFKRDVSSWRELFERNKAQADVFADIVKRGRSLAALCKHSTPLSRDIDVRHDVESFNLMGCDTATGGVYCSDKIITGDKWFFFVDTFVRFPAKTCHEVVFDLVHEK